MPHMILLDKAAYRDGAVAQAMGIFALHVLT